jgi:hypothetical protein
MVSILAHSFCLCGFVPVCVCVQALTPLHELQQNPSFFLQDSILQWFYTDKSGTFASRLVVLLCTLGFMDRLTDVVFYCFMLLP